MGVLSVAQSNLPILSAEGGLSRYLQEIRKFPMLEPNEEFMLAKRYKEHGDPGAAQKLITSHLRLVAKIAMGYRGYGLPISEVISEGNVGLMHAVKRFEPDKGFRLATYAMWWIRAAIQEYVLRSWSLVKIGTTAAQKRLFFNLRKVKGQIAALDDGNLHPDQIKQIATTLSVTEADVVSMNQRLTGDASLNAPMRADEGTSEWQDWLVDDTPDQETTLGDSEEYQRAHGPPDRRHGRAQRPRKGDLPGPPPAGEPLDPRGACAAIRRHRASASGRSRSAPSKRSRTRSRKPRATGRASRKTPRPAPRLRSCPCRASRSTSAPCGCGSWRIRRSR